MNWAKYNKKEDNLDSHTAAFVEAAKFRIYDALQTCVWLRNK
jgi:hypothetical protein